MEVIEGTEDNKGEEGLASLEGGKEILAQQKKKEVARSSEEASVSCSPTHKQSLLMLKDKKVRNKGKRKKGKGNGEGSESSPICLVC